MMKRLLVMLVLCAVVSFSFYGGSVAAFAAEAENGEGPGSVIVQKEHGLIDWTQNYVETTGVGVVPTGKKGAQAKALARRAAIVDLQRNLLEFLVGVQIDSRTTMNDFMAEDRVRQEVHGTVRNVEILDGEWDGESYTVSGRVKLAQLRVIVAPSIKPDPVRVAVVEEERKTPPAKKTAGRFTGLIIDVRHLSLVPSMTFNVLDENGRAVYGIEFTEQEHYLQSGLCAYYNNISYARGEVHVATNPIVTTALKLSSGNVDIVIRNSDAAKVRGSSYDFRKECKVIVVCK